ncbi:MAG: hypothetical protein IIU83_06715 [Fibrobacteraceae bacterium]|nr:hypothetical protein [Fibrobacteraceae bacterium]
MIRKSFFLVSIAVLSLNTASLANKCTDAWFTPLANPYLNPESEFHIDSSYFNENGNEWTHKYIYKDGKIAETQDDPKEEGEEIRIFPFYSDTNETALKNKGIEYIVSKCQAKDTLCYQEKVYSNGEYRGIRTTKITPNYITVEQVEDNTLWFTEYILTQDSVIEKRYFDYNTDSVRTSQKFYVADPNNDNKCYEYDADGQINYTLLYKPNEKGYSVSIEEGTYLREFFFIKNEGTTSIRKTVKPVKIAPKARYFDLLGRYKFTK